MSIAGDKSLWPPDSATFVFVGHALDRIGTAETWQALQSGELQAGVTVVGANDWRTPILIASLVFHNAQALLYENQIEDGTLAALGRTLAQQIFKYGQINFLDRHPGTPVRHRRRIPIPHWLYVSRRSLDELAAKIGLNPKSPPAQNPKRGRKSSVDWDAIELALRTEISQRGDADPQNSQGWQHQADIERWVSDLLSARKESAAESTVRDHVSKITKRIRAGK